MKHMLALSGCGVTARNCCRGNARTNQTSPSAMASSSSTEKKSIEDEERDMMALFDGKTLFDAFHGRVREVCAAGTFRFGGRGREGGI